MVETWPLNPQKDPRLGVVTLILQIKKLNLAEVERPSEWDGKPGSHSGLPAGISQANSFLPFCSVCLCVCWGREEGRDAAHVARVDLELTKQPKTA